MDYESLAWVGGWVPPFVDLDDFYAADMKHQQEESSGKGMLFYTHHTKAVEQLTTKKTKNYPSTSKKFQILAVFDFHLYK